MWSGIRSAWSDGRWRRDREWSSDTGRTARWSESAGARRPPASRSDFGSGALLAAVVIGLPILYTGVLHLARPIRVESAGSSSVVVHSSAPPPSFRRSPGPPTAPRRAPAPAGRGIKVAVPARLPEGALNVRKFGARGDGATDDRQAIVTALGSLKAGGALYFPPGRYRLSDKVVLNKAGVRLVGAGPESQILMPEKEDCLQLGSGPVIGPVTVERLKFVGLRIWDRSRNHYKAILIFGARGCVIRDCVFEGAGTGVMDAEPTRNTRIQRCRFLDWGGVAVFLNGGAHVSGCHFEQNDPDLKGEKTSHGLYIHSGATDVTVEDCSIIGARKYGIQVWGEQQGTEIARVQIRNNIFNRNASHLVVGATPQGPVISDIRIENNRFSGSDGTSVILKKGAGILFRHNRIIDSGGHGIQVGAWAPYEPGMRLEGTRIEENQIDWTTGPKRTGGQYGIWALGRRGSLRNLRLLENTIGGFADNDYPGGGIVLDRVDGGAVRGNRINMPDYAGRTGSCAGIWINDSSAMEVSENEIRIPENPNAVALRLETNNRDLTQAKNTTRRERKG